MADKKGTIITVVFGGATEKFLCAKDKMMVVNCPPDKREQVIAGLSQIVVADDYPHHPVDALTAGMSGEFMNHVSEYHVEHNVDPDTVPDVVAKWAPAQAKSAEKAGKAASPQPS